MLRELGLYYVHGGDDDVGRTEGTGGGREEEVRRGIGLLRRCAEGGCAKSWYDLCLAYRYGEGGVCDGVKAHECHKLAAEGGYEIAMFELGVGLEDGHLEGEADEDLAFVLFKKLYEMERKSGLLKLASCYLRGVGCKADVELGVKLVFMACDEGNWMGLLQVAKLYEEGFGIVRSWENSLKYLKMAADCPQGGKALYQLAGYYASGYMVEVDHNAAFRCCEMAAEQGFDQAIYALGCMYLNGVHVEKDEERGVDFMNRAAGLGHTEASRIMAQRYQGGKGVEKNVDMAAYLFTKAAGHGDAEASYHLGNMYDKGLGVEKDEAAALRHYKMAADEGIVDALTEVAARTFRM